MWGWKNNVVSFVQVIVLIVIAVSSTEMAYAHARFLADGVVPPRSDNDGIKTGPCGSDPRSSNPSVFRPGQQITVEWEETINHPGYFTIAFSPANDTGYNENILYQLEDTQNDLAVPHLYSADITLPNVECDSCSLQLIQYMTERDPPSLYYSCADIRLVAENPNTPPAPVQNVVSANGNNETSLAWEYSGSADLQTIILRSTSPIVDEPQDGQVLYENNFVGDAQVVYAGSGSQFVSTNLTAGQIYYYALYAYNEGGFYSQAVRIEVTAEQALNDTTAPAPVTAFSGTAAAGSVELSWSNPTEDFYKVLIVWDSNPIVSNPIDANRYQPGDYLGTSQVVFNGLGENATITGMVTGETYYFRIYAHDGSYNFSSGTDTSVFLPNEGDNQKPEVSLAISQNNVPVTRVYPDKGNVTIRALIDDDSDISQATIVWTGTDSRIVDLDTVADALTFDPSQLPEGYYTIRVTVADNGNPPQSTSLEMSLMISSSDGNESGAGGMGHLGLILILLVLQRFYAMRTRRV